MYFLLGLHNFLYRLSGVSEETKTLLLQSEHVLWPLLSFELARTSDAMPGKNDKTGRFCLVPLLIDSDMESKQQV